MSDIKVKTGKGEDSKVVTVTYDMPTTVGDFVNKYGEEQSAALLVRAVTLAIQATVRQKAAAGADPSTLQATVDAWQPGVRAAVTKKSPMERAQSALAGLGKEDLEALLAEYRKNAKHGK